MLNHDSDLTTMLSLLTNGPEYVSMTGLFFLSLYSCEIRVCLKIRFPSTSYSPYIFFPRIGVHVLQRKYQTYFCNFRSVFWLIP